jgi:putative copper resistance protein D
MELFWPLVVVRALHLWSLLALFGASLFAIYGGCPPGGAQTLGKLKVWLAGIALASGVGFVMALLVSMTEEVDSLVSAARWQAFLLATGFGRVWLLRLVGLAALLLWVAGHRAGPNRWHADAALGAALLVSLAWVGHAGAGEGAEAFGGMLALGCHVLAAGAWLGGLVPLSIALARARAGGDPEPLCHALESFSRLGLAAVALILASGILSAGLTMQGFGNLGRTPYGKVLLAKIALFAILLAVAAANRFLFLRRLRRQTGPGPTEGRTEAQTQIQSRAQIEIQIRAQIRALTRSIAAEHAIGLALVALAAALSSLAPVD